jgi:hypothetical protein
MFIDDFPAINFHLQGIFQLATFHYQRITTVGAGCLNSQSWLHQSTTPSYLVVTSFFCKLSIQNMKANRNSKHLGDSNV